MSPRRRRRSEQRQSSPPLPSSPPPPPMTPGRQRSPSPPPMPPGPRPRYHHPWSVSRLPDDSEDHSDLIRPHRRFSPELEMAQRQEDRETDALKELLATTTLEESSITNASSSSLPQSPSHADKEPNAFKELLETTTPEKSSITNVPSSSLLQSPLFEMLDTTLLSPPSVFSLVPRGLLINYFVRVDKWGFFLTYPDRGGPFKSLLEAQEAIDSYHVVQRKIMCMDGLSDEERSVRYALYWYHNGTRKHSAEALAACVTLPTDELVKALLDKHNEDNDLVGDLAYQLEDIVTHKSCSDGKGCIYRSYSHFNMIMKTKGAGSNKDLYFAEVMCMRGDYEAYVLTCICVVKPDDNGECHVCGVDMKHPTHEEYNHGRPKLFCIRPDASLGDYLFEELFAVRDEAWLKAEETRVRRMIKEGKEARRKLEVGNIEDGDGKRSKYVIPAKR